ncbi:uncharacterized protein BCR38DRAFT_405494 [Pseudomassariella vexata]|uniref:TPR-like protein n=1 Tax=Pseudomassariella vexata TaxID=1141098 RepID=A0A1Y2EE11_9PEZI|nr:uncharacterized protein BCR38DRAFT_405494 [Pseudomassariella vexata]ORY69818.1 hypothetical protein BCR38DRAFT_405494 [Pseudomassariella vexata]
MEGHQFHDGAGNSSHTQPPAQPEIYPNHYSAGNPSQISLPSQVVFEQMSANNRWPKIQPRPILPRPQGSGHTEQAGNAWQSIQPRPPGQQVQPPSLDAHDGIGNMSLDDEVVEEVGESEPVQQQTMGLPPMQRKVSTSNFEDSVRSFVGVRDQRRGGFPDSRAQPLQPRKNVIRKGPRKAAEPTGDVKMRLNYANVAYVEGRLDEALDYVNDAIRVNAEIHRAWSMLANIHYDKKNYKESLLASVCAAHLQPKFVEGWLKCATDAIGLMDETPDDADDLSRIALSTFSQAIRVDPSHLAARAGKAALLLARESYKAATAEYAAIVERAPCDVHALRGLVEAAVKLQEHGKKVDYDGKPEAARDAYRECIARSQTNGNSPDLPFEWDDAIIYIELLTHLRQYADALKETKSISRWLLGRVDEAYWDHVDDDREWDEHNERRNQVPEFVPDKYPSSTYGAGLPPHLRVKLAVCRLRLNQEDEAKIHIDLLDPVDGSDSNVKSEYPDLFLEMATVLWETMRYEMALRFYEPLRNTDMLDAAAFYRAGKCYLATGDKRQAEECFTAAIDLEEPEEDDTPVYGRYEIDARIQSRYELAKMYEAAKHEAEAYILVNEAMRLEEDREDSASESDSETGGEGEEKTDEATIKDTDKPKPKPRARARAKPKHNHDKTETAKKPQKPRMIKTPNPPRPPKEPRSRAQRPLQRPRPKLFALDEEKAKEEEKRSADLAQKWHIVRTGRQVSSDGGPGSVWMEAANELVDDFRSFRGFYPWDRYLVHMGLKQDRPTTSSTNPALLKMAERLRDNLDPTQLDQRARTTEVTVGYRDVGWQEWLDLFIEYALNLAHYGKVKEAYSICDSAKDANVFFENPEDIFLIQVAIAACALRGRDEEKCIEVARYFMSKNLFASDAFRMYAALCRLCASSATWYADTRVQKFTLRQIKIMDAKLLREENKPDRSLDEYEAKHYPHDQLHVPLLMLYGHILFISNSFTYALNYFIRAHASDPDNLMINISIGQAYVHYALKRQAENRQYLIIQGFAFLEKYYNAKLRLATTPAQRQEAHYNLARSYHSIGLMNLAAEYYRRVLREVEGLVDKAREEMMQAGGENLAREAAYNLQAMCFIGGDMEAVQKITERWLVL